MPYRLLIVEDEDFIREAIVNCLSWEEIGFQVREAPDGEIALQIAEDFLPDALLTDVRMPFIDGLELTQRLIDKNPRIVAVVLSGHDEFEYAQAALQRGVMDYLVKPVRPKMLEATMRKVKDALDSRRSKQFNFQKLQHQLRQSLPLLQREHLKNLISANANTSSELATLEYLGVLLRGTAYTVCVFRLDFPADASMEDQQLMHFAAHNILEEEFGTDARCFTDADDQHVAIYCNRSSVYDERLYLNDLITSINETLCDNLNLIVTAGIGQQVDSLDALPYSYGGACSAMRQLVLLGKGKVYDILDTIEPQKPFPLAFNSSNELLSALRWESPEKLSSEIDHYFERFIKMQYIQKDLLYILLIDVLNSANKLLLDSGCSDCSDAPHLYARLFETSTLSEMSVLVRQYLMNVKSQLDAMRKSKSVALINVACRYISTNYHLSDISLRSVAEQVHITPSYLSTLFKRELNTTFVDYLTALRIENAKELLLSEEDLKTYEVAARVGYNDPQYFSSCFKKYTGSTPSEYRRRRE